MPTPFRPAPFRPVPRRVFLALALVWTVVLLAGMLTPGSGVPAVFSLYDKATHATAFFVFAFLWSLALPGTARSHLAQVLVLSVVFAVGTEVLQAMLPIGRFGDPFDAVADLVGAALGSGAALWWGRRAERRSDDNAPFERIDEGEPAVGG